MIKVVGDDHFKLANQSKGLSISNNTTAFPMRELIIFLKRNCKVAPLRY